MKPINCIDTIPVQQQYAIRHWYIISACTIIITCSIMIYFLAPQIHALYKQREKIAQLSHKTKNYTELLSAQTTLKKEHENHEKKQRRIALYKNNPKSPHPYLLSITQLCKKSIQLERIQKNNKTLEITLLCPTPEDATTFINNLSETKQFNTLKLTSLQRDTHYKKFRCIIKGTIAP